MEYRLFAKGREGCSQLLQMKYTGKTLLNVFQTNSLDFNANKTNRKGACERITVKSEVIFHLDLISKVGQTAKHSTIDTSVSAFKR